MLSGGGPVYTAKIKKKKKSMRASDHMTVIFYQLIYKIIFKLTTLNQLKNKDESSIGAVKKIKKIYKINKGERGLIDRLIKNR